MSASSLERISLVRELFGKCSHQEQVGLLATLSLHLKRDFLTSLPRELVEYVLSFLDLSCVLGCCVLVSFDMTSRKGKPVSVGVVVNIHR